ncbi:MAG: septal ring lytic transglycosylase RlpA family protein [Armatimonadota bacterium]
MRKGSRLGRLGLVYRCFAAMMSPLFLMAWGGMLPKPADAARKKNMKRVARAKPAQSRSELRARYAPTGKVINTRATWYGPGFHGRRTASGERFNQNAMTLASRHLPFGTRVRVTHLKTGRSAVGRVNDRGPFGKRSVTADLSRGLARRIGLTGTDPIRLEILGPVQKPAIAKEPSVLPGAG